MGVDISVGRVFLIHVLVQLDLHEMLQDVGVITRVKGVAVAQHKGIPMKKVLTALVPPLSTKVGPDDEKPRLSGDGRGFSK
jgi:hypothetical protein